jgi:hypothetical protein
MIINVEFSGNYIYINELKYSGIFFKNLIERVKQNDKSVVTYGISHINMLVYIKFIKTTYRANEKFTFEPDSNFYILKNIYEDYKKWITTN